MTDTVRQIELARERRDLLKAEQDIVEGERRVDQQHELIARLSAQGHETVQAYALLNNFENMLDAWYAHRALILGRIDLLESAAP
jgi:hypothetical protein